MSGTGNAAALVLGLGMVVPCGSPMGRLAQFEASDLGDRMNMISTLGRCVLERHEKQCSTLYYSVSDFFVQVRFEGTEHHPCLSMIPFTTADALCDDMLEHLEEVG